MGRKARLKAERAATRPDAPVTAATQPAPLPTDYRIVAAIAVALVILVAVVFAQLRGHQFLNYDDPIYITENEQVKKGLTAEGVSWAFRSLDFNWHPATWLTHMADVEIFGLNAGAHLLVNVGFHALNTILLLFILHRATGSVFRSGIVAALFAIHPLHVESVAWISERKDVLSTLFMLLTILFYLQFVERRSKGTYAAMTIAFVLGLMSKGMLVTLPFALLLIDYWPLQRFRLGEWRTLGRLFMEKLPLFILILPAIFITWYAQHVVGAMANVRFISLPIRLANAVISYVVYIRRMFWPDDLALGYPYPTTISSTTTIACAILLLAITAVVLYFRECRYLVTGWFWFTGMLVPVSGIVQIGPQAMADRYTYVPLIGLFIALVWLIGDLVTHRPILRIPATTITAGVLIGLAFAAHTQAGYWKSSETLFRRTAQVTPRNPVAHETLGFALFRNGDYEGAIREFQALIALRPQYGRAYEGLGASLLGLGRTAEAIEAYRTAVRINPQSAEGLRQLGQLEMSAGKTEDAKESLAKAAQLGDKEAAGSLAMARGDADAAIGEYKALVEKDPNSPEARNNLAAALARKGRDDEALQTYREALRLAPFHYDANMNIGALLARKGNANEAVSHFLAATRARPDSTEPHVYLALILAGSGQTADAIAEIERAMKINAVTANNEFTNATRSAPNPNNLAQFLQSLKTK